MTLEKVHIQNRGPLVDFTAEFGPITVIYGPNASGKSLLSNTLRSVERAKELKAGEATVSFNDYTVKSPEFTQGKAENRIRVFNADFMRDDVIDAAPGAIVLGSEVQEQRTKIDKLGRRLAELESQRDQRSKEILQMEKSLGDKQQEAGERVRKVLRTVPKIEGANPRWPKFDRRDARRSYENMLKDNGATSHRRSSNELDDLAEAISERPSNVLTKLHTDDPAVLEMHTRATVLLRTIPNTGSLPEVDNDPGRRDWLLKGHGYASSQGHCAYCHQVVPPDRLETLDAFFNQDMTTLLGDIDELMRDINLKAETLRTQSLPPVIIRSERTFKAYTKASARDVVAMLKPPHPTSQPLRLTSRVRRNNRH